jgi:hypothetical protein
VKPNGEILKIEDYVSWDNDTPEEIGKTITKIYMDTGLDQMPFAITGQMCVNRGLTFQNEQFLFDFGIGFNLTDRAIAYQCLARMFGNIKHFQSYKQSTIVTTSRMKKLVQQSENIAVNIGKHVYDNELEFVDKDTIKALARDGLHESISHLEEFNSMDELIQRWKTIISQGQQKFRSPMKPRQVEGVYVCSVGGNSERQSATTIRTKFSGTSTSNWGSGLTTATPGEYIHRVYAGYEEDSSVKFFLRWTQKV